MQRYIDHRLLVPLGSKNYYTMRTFVRTNKLEPPNVHISDKMLSSCMFNLVMASVGGYVIGLGIGFFFSGLDFQTNHDSKLGFRS
jgi:hypothetical protein